MAEELSNAAIVSGSIVSGSIVSGSIVSGSIVSGSIVNRWRLVLGRHAESSGLNLSDETSRLAENLLEYVFGEDLGTREQQQQTEQRGEQRGQVIFKKATPKRVTTSGSSDETQGDRQGGTGPPVFTVPVWVEKVRELFPVRAREVLEKEFIKRRGLAGLLAEPRLLERVEPSLDLVKILLSHKTLLTPQTRPVARKLIDQVVSELKHKIKQAVVPALTGALRRDRHSTRAAFRNLDIKRTIWRNLQHYDAQKTRLLVERLHFFEAGRKQRPWHVIIAVDQSGSMLESAVFSAIMASIFAELPSLRTSLILFDTEVVDLSGKVGQPVDVLLSVQLGGGTDIAKAVRYAAQLVREPRKTILVLISDFCEGGDLGSLLHTTELLANAGVSLIGLAALGYEGRPDYDHTNARSLRRAGMDILVCTPEHLTECVARVIRG